MRRVGAVLVALLAVPATAAALTREEVRDRSAAICAKADAAMQPHDDRAHAALEERRWNAFVRHGRRSLRTGEPYVRRLARLDAPARGRERYAAFVDQTQRLVRRLRRLLNAVDGRRFRAAARHDRRADAHRRRAIRAARRYPLRRPCVKMLRVN